MVDIEIRRSAARRPKAREIVEPLENWLSSLDPDEVTDQIAAGMAVPQLVLNPGDWIIDYVAWPVEPEHRGEKGRLIGMYPMTGGFTSSEVVHYREIVSRKGGRYGQPDKPLIVAVLNTSGFFDQNDVAEALFGSEVFEYIPGQDTFMKTVRRRDGYWRQGPPPRGARVSAILDGENLYPWRVSDHLPKLWINPWAEKPVTANLPFATFTAHDTGEVYQQESGTSAEAVLGLSADWPGFARQVPYGAGDGRETVRLPITPSSVSPRSCPRYMRTSKGVECGLNPLLPRVKSSRVAASARLPPEYAPMFLLRHGPAYGPMLLPARRS
jgi:hypothetical protein